MCEWVSSNRAHDFVICVEWKGRTEIPCISIQNSLFLTSRARPTEKVLTRVPAEFNGTCARTYICTMSTKIDFQRRFESDAFSELSHAILPLRTSSYQWSDLKTFPILHVTFLKSALYRNLPYVFQGIVFLFARTNKLRDRKCLHLTFSKSLLADVSYKWQTPCFRAFLKTI
jgi:hypothetical protein